jgi:ferritin-like metal-binding protein YciE
MGIASLKDLYLDELAGLYDAERQTIRTLPRLVDAARAPELKEALAKHVDESRLHLERLQLIFTHWGEKVPSQGCAGLAGIVQEADGRLTEAATADARDAAIIGVAQRIEHYEMAAYGCARTYARRLNRPDEARLLQETLDEEGRADHRLTEIAEAHVNDDARSEADLNEPAPGKRLRYVDARQLDYRRLSQGTLEVRNDADEKLGVFDGLIFDATSGRPHYIVVDSGGVFSAHRYLLPVGHVRFDDRARVLRVDLARDVAARYPAYDRDEFTTMTDEALQGYEGRLLDFFKRDTGTRRPHAASEDRQPEWLMTGVWMTVPPALADRLSDDARSFANEFAPNQDQVVAHDNGGAAGDPRPNSEREGGTPRPASEDDAPAPPHGEKLR